MAENRYIFPSTRWTQIAIATGDPNSKVKFSVLNDLIQQYYPVLKTHLITVMKVRADKAEDILQDFIKDKVLERNLFASADKTKGRFRSFLLRVFSNYVVSKIREYNAQKRGPSDSQRVNIDENPDVIAYQQSIEAQFNTSWAKHVLTEAIERMKKECADKDRQDVWTVFESRILNPILDDEPPQSIEVLMRQLSVNLPEQVSNMLHTGKRMFRRNLEGIIRDTVLADGDLDEELRDLHLALSQPPVMVER